MEPSNVKREKLMIAGRSDYALFHELAAETPQALPEPAEFAGLRRSVCPAPRSRGGLAICAPLHRQRAPEKSAQALPVRLCEPRLGFGRILQYRENFPYALRQ